MDIYNTTKICNVEKMKKLLLKSTQNMCFDECKSITNAGNSRYLALQSPTLPVFKICNFHKLVLLFIYIVIGKTKSEVYKRFVIF